MESVQASSSRGISFWIVSPVWPPKDSLTKIAGWMDKMEKTEILSKTINAPSEHEKSSVLKPVNAEQSLKKIQFEAQRRVSRPPVKPFIPPTDAAVQDDGIKRMKIEIGACVQSSTTQPEENSATTKPSRTINVGQKQFLSTKRSNLSSAFGVPQFGHMPRQQLSSQVPNPASNAWEDYFIRSSVPKLNFSEFSGDPLERPKWSQLFQATMQSANVNGSLKMNHSKTMVTTKSKVVIAGLGYTAEMCNVAWNVLVRKFGKPQMAKGCKCPNEENFSFVPMKRHDRTALINYARLVSSCVNVLTQFNYVGDISSEEVLQQNWLWAWKRSGALLWSKRTCINPDLRFSVSGSTIWPMFKMSCLCLRTRMRIAGIQATKKRPRAPYLQDQQ